MTVYKINDCIDCSFVRIPSQGFVLRAGKGTDEPFTERCYAAPV